MAVAGGGARKQRGTCDFLGQELQAGGKGIGFKVAKKERRVGKLNSLGPWSHFLEVCPPPYLQIPSSWFSFIRDPPPSVHTEATGQFLGIS